MKTGSLTKDAAWNVIRTFKHEEGVASLEERLTTFESVCLANDIARALERMRDATITECVNKLIECGEWEESGKVKELNRLRRQ